MNQVDYTLSLQRILLLVGSISFFTLVLVGFFVSPLENPEYLLLVLFLIWVCLSSVFGLLGYWWAFNIRKEIISINQSNLTVWQGSFQASLTVGYIALNYAKMWQNWMFFGILVGVIIYWLFVKSYQN
jgi:hypothetical protein